MNIQGLGGTAVLYQTANKPALQRQFLDLTAAKYADEVSISEQAQALLEKERGSGSSAASAVANYDTDKGSVSLNIDEYFSATPTTPLAELPPLLMPTQKNIDALTAHISATFPRFLSDHGISTAPSSISYDREGQPVFPADYPYAEQLKKALDDSPSMARELSAVSALSEFKQMLDESVAFQEAYRSATTQEEIQAVLAKFSDLLSENKTDFSATLNFSREGALARISISRTSS